MLPRDGVVRRDDSCHGLGSRSRRERSGFVGVGGGVPRGARREDGRGRARGRRSCFRRVQSGRAGGVISLLDGRRGSGCCWFRHYLIFGELDGVGGKKTEEGGTGRRLKARAGSPSVILSFPSRPSDISAMTDRKNLRLFGPSRVVRLLFELHML